MRPPWQRDDEPQESDSEVGELRQEGSNVRAMTSVAEIGGGFIPLHKEPSRYVRVRPHNKKEKEFDRLFLAQELLGTKATCEETTIRTTTVAVGTKIMKGGDAIWAAEFSLDGQYLAIGGKDQIVRVFAVLSSPEERQQEEDEERERCNGESLSAPVFRSKPIREFSGHAGEVLALSWSKNNFLLSASMDKTVKLWHMTRQECLASFQHNDLVTSIAFHPTDDRFFLAGSLDAQLRLWSIPDKDVAYSAQTSEFITAVAFSPDGKTSICGLLSGLCLLYDTEGLKLTSQIHVRSSRGRNAKGSKITGIRTVKSANETGESDVKVLISSNDSRIRVYSLKTRMQEVKFRGPENSSSQIHARFSDDARFVVCGSEDRKAYLWDMTDVDMENKDKQPYEAFDANREVVTAALMAPVGTRQLLSASGDPVYDLCNPPPVTLRSLDETTSQSGNSDLLGDTGSVIIRKVEESPAYLERTSHPGGHIIITTDRTGTIKVFRQDCAFAKRQQQWETGSRFSGKLAGIGRSASIVTKTSAGSRRGSLNLSPSGILSPSLSSDRIQSWRHGIEGGNGRPTLAGLTLRTERSMSPMKQGNSPLNASVATLVSEARKPSWSSPATPTAGSSAAARSPVLRTSKPQSPAISLRKTTIKLPPKDDTRPTSPPTPGFSLTGASDSEQQEEKEGSFWNLSRWKGLSGLRYSTTSPSLLGGTGASSSVAAKATQSGSSLPSKTGAEGKQASSRRSLAVSDLGRLMIAEDVDRRKSMGAAIPSEQSVAGSGAKASGTKDKTKVAGQKDTRKSVDKGRKGERPGFAERRTDSGVGRFSAETSGV